MKKILAIALALVMALSLTVTVFADEVIWEEETMFFSNGNWSEYTTELGTEALVEALSTPGAYFVITRSNTPDGMTYPDNYEKFCLLDSWWSGSITRADESTCQWIAMGTANHTIAMATAGGQPYDIDVDAVLDDGINAWYDAADILALWTAGNFNTTGGGDCLHIISNSSPDGVYDIVKVSIVVPAEPIVTEEPEGEEVPAEEEESAEPTVVVEETAVYVLSTNYSDNDSNNGKAVNECALVGDWYSDKFATSWKNGAEWTKLIDALKTEGSTLKIKCDGNVSRLGFQSDLANTEFAVECVDGVVSVAGADVLAACADALADGYAWCNFIISGDAGTVISEIAVTVTTETVLESTTEEEPEAEETPAEDTPADTGIALAVVPMIVAAAAIALSKKR